MEHRIERREAFHVVGVRERFEPGKIDGIPALWHRFLAISENVPDEIAGAHYGVCIDDRDPAAGAPGFFYMACTGVTSLERVPEGMVGYTVPAGKYAVFTHRGPISTFARTITKIWREEIPAAGLKTTGAPDLEVYGERFRGESPESEVEVWVPVAG